MDLLLINYSISKWVVNYVFTARLLLVLVEISRLSIALFLVENLLLFIDINEFSLLTILLISLAFNLLSQKPLKANCFKYAAVLLTTSYILFFSAVSLFSEHPVNVNGNSAVA